MQLDEPKLRDFVNFGSTDDKFHNQIKKIFWLPEVDDVTPDQTIGILIRADQDVYSQVRKSQDQLLLHSWEGLVLELPTSTTETLRVIKDVVTSHGLSERYLKHHRKIVINHESNGKVTKQSVYSEEQFRKFLEENRNDPNGAPVRPFRAYWEVPTELLEHQPRKAAELLGQWALGFTPNVGPRTVKSFPDELRQMILACENRETSRKFGMKLRQLMRSIGVQQLQDFGTAIRNEYIQDKNRLGLAQIADSPSVERIIWDIVKARYYYDFPAEAVTDKTQVGTFQADPLGADVRARTRQRDLIDYLIGQDIARRALNFTTRPKPTNHVHPRSGQIIIDEVPIIEIRRGQLDLLQPDAKKSVEWALGAIHAKMMKNIEKDPDDREPITWAELARVGREARRSINE